MTLAVRFIDDAVELVFAGAVGDMVEVWFTVLLWVIVIGVDALAVEMVEVFVLVDHGAALADIIGLVDVVVVLTMVVSVDMEELVTFAVPWWIWKRLKDVIYI